MIGYLQAVELFPTPIRNTAMGFVAFTSLLLGLPGAHVTHLATIDKRIPYLIMAVLALCGSISSSFLPETIRCHLPETLVSASEYGRKQKYFSWSYDRKDNPNLNLSL